MQMLEFIEELAKKICEIELCVSNLSVLGVDLSAPSALDVGRRAAAQAALKAALNVTGRTGSDYRSRVWSLVAIESIIWVLNFPQKPPSLAVICAWVRLFLNQEEIYEVL